MLRWTMAAPELADDTGRSIDPDLLSGRWSEVVDQYRRIPTRRWVVLGQSGSGKSALVLHLMRQLLADRRADDQAPIPVLFPMASWNPKQRPHEWMAAHLAETFPALRMPARAKEAQRQELLEMLVLEPRVLPILDGLDEMREERRLEAIKALNDLDWRFPYVLTSRTREFADAVDQGDRRLVRAAVVELQPLTLAQAETYLRRVPRSSRAEWSDLLSRLDRSHPLAEALSTPLMVWLAGASYAHRPGELACLADTGAVTDRLLDELVATVYDDDDPRWPTAEVGRWLTYLATYVHRRQGATTDGDPDDIAWWRLADAAEPLVSVAAAVAALVSTGASFGLGIGILFGPRAGVVAGLACGLPVGLASARSRLPPNTLEVRLRPRLAVGAAAGLMLGLVGGAAVWVARHDGTALWAMAGFGLPLGTVYSVTSPVDVARATSPATVLRRERDFVLAYVFAYGLACGTVGWVLASPTVGVVLGVIAGLSGGLFNGLPWLLVFGLLRRGEVEARCGAVAWFRFLLAKITWLGSPPQLPWRLMTFLEDARQRGVLRQVGAVYQFRHGRLSERLVFRAGGDSTGDGSHSR